MMSRERRDRIERLLQRGGAIHREDERYHLHHPSAIFELKRVEALELLEEGSLVVVNCGCTGFWWALRPDLVAMRSAREALGTKVPR